MSLSTLTGACRHLQSNQAPLHLQCSPDYSRASWHGPKVLSMVLTLYLNHKG